MAKIQKAKYWTAVLYPESMIDDWFNVIDDVLQIPYEYCVHDKDLLNDSDENRKVHVHLVIAFPNTTTYNHALSIFQKLQPSCMFCEQVTNIRYLHNYLIHDTDSCKKKNKHKYDISERICGNNFDIGSFEQLSISDKREMLRELCFFIRDNRIDNFMDFFIVASDFYNPEYFEVIASYSGMLERLCKGVYLQNLRD